MPRRSTAAAQQLWFPGQALSGWTQSGSRKDRQALGPLRRQTFPERHSEPLPPRQGHGVFVGIFDRKGWL